MNQPNHIFMFLEKTNKNMATRLFSHINHHCLSLVQDDTCLRSTVSDDHLNPLVWVWSIHAITVTFYYELAIESEY